MPYNYKLHLATQLKYSELEMGLVKYGILLTTLTLALAEIQNECVVPIASRRHLYIQWPLIYKPGGELYPVHLDTEQQTASVHLPVGEEVLLSCGPNYLKNFNRAETLSVKCESDGKLKSLSPAADIQNEAKPVSYYGCDLRVVEEVLSTVNDCNNQAWTPVAFGYVNPFDHLTHIVGEACYDENEGRTIFAHIKLSSMYSTDINCQMQIFLNEIFCFKKQILHTCNGCQKTFSLSFTIPMDVTKVSFSAV